MSFDRGLLWDEKERRGIIFSSVLVPSEHVPCLPLCLYLVLLDAQHAEQARDAVCYLGMMEEHAVD